MMPLPGHRVVPGPPLPPPSVVAVKSSPVLSLTKPPFGNTAVPWNALAAAAAPPRPTTTLQHKRYSLTADDDDVDGDNQRMTFANAIEFIGGAVKLTHC